MKLDDSIFFLLYRFIVILLEIFLAMNFLLQFIYISERRNTVHFVTDTVLFYCEIKIQLNLCQS